ncbi:MAG: UDP-galactopyranose mutase, partial [Fimbriimonadaceae bacterium]|nr:UDP-galactopyranose mutase [Fimbriimonadaceae bacterium]
MLFVEEPFYDLEPGQEPTLELQSVAENVTVAIPHLPNGAVWEESHDTLRDLTERAIEFVNTGGHFERPVLWYYSPMM